MKYKTQLIIDSPLHVVTELFAEGDNEELWHSSMVSRQKNEFDANKSICLYEVNGRHVEVLVHFMNNNLPDTIDVEVYLLGMQLKISHKFVELDNGQTKWEINTEYTVDGLMLKLTMLLAPKMFISRVQLYMAEFKTFVMSDKNYSLI